MSGKLTDKDKNCLLLLARSSKQPNGWSCVASETLFELLRQASVRMPELMQVFECKGWHEARLTPLGESLVRFL